MFDATMEPLLRPGPSKETWNTVEEQFEKQGALALLHCVACVLVTWVLLNGCDVPVP